MSERNYDATTIMKRGFPQFKKLGAVSPNGEMTPFVWKGKLYRMELDDPSKGLDQASSNGCGIRDCETGKFIAHLAKDSYFHSLYQEGDTVYVLGVDLHSRDTLHIYESQDLLHWESRILLRNPGWQYCNTALTKGPDGYVLLMESDHPEYAGVPYTFFFARSNDLKTWTHLDPETYVFSKERYMGGPWMKYVDGWYYVISVTELPCKRYTNYIYRTKDFLDWEVGLYNPLLSPSEEDRILSPNVCDDLTEQMRQQIKTGFLASSSDMDLCDWNGKTYINYLLGNQLGFYYMAEAVYDGTVAEFLRANFE